MAPRLSRRHGQIPLVLLLVLGCILIATGTAGATGVPVPPTAPRCGVPVSIPSPGVTVQACAQDTGDIILFSGTATFMPISSTIPWTFCSITVITADATTGVAQQRSIDCLKFARQGVAQSWTSSQVTSLAGHKVYMQAWVQGIVGSRLFKTATATSPTMISE